MSDVEHLRERVRLAERLLTLIRDSARFALMTGLDRESLQGSLTSIKGAAEQFLNEP